MLTNISGSVSMSHCFLISQFHCLRLCLYSIPKRCVLSLSDSVACKKLKGKVGKVDNIVNDD